MRRASGPMSSPGDDFYEDPDMSTPWSGTDQDEENNARYRDELVRLREQEQRHTAEMIRSYRERHAEAATASDIAVRALAELEAMAGRTPR